MKYILSAILISFAVGSASAFHTQPDEARSTETCGSPTDALPFYRSYNPTVVDHFYTTSVSRANSAFTISYALESVAALVFVTQEESTVPLYWLYSTTAIDNFYTISTTARDAAVEIGYSIVTPEPVLFIYPTQVCGSVPFYHLYHKTKIDNFYTTSESEKLDFVSNKGYTDVDIQGYVLPVTSTQCA
ncbi:hypothetical protein B0H14DRAFT_3907544 [Mycena olivaceomarginata]|nr:hypothetical protein B0H14DRAFT_3907544 [Mycena olivaceomarginata]